MKQIFINTFNSFIKHPSSWLRYYKFRRIFFKLILTLILYTQFIIVLFLLVFIIHLHFILLILFIYLKFFSYSILKSNLKFVLSEWFWPWLWIILIRIQMICWKSFKISCCKLYSWVFPCICVIKSLSYSFISFSQYFIDDWGLIDFYFLMIKGW